FDELVERLRDPEKGMTVEKAAEICDLDPALIYKAARMYGTAKPASILWGLAVDQKTNGQQNAHVILALTALTGNIDVPGGQLAQPAGEIWSEKDFGYTEIEDMADFQGKMIGMDKYPLACSLVFAAHPDLTLQCMETDEPFPIRMGFFMGSNPTSNTAGEPKRWQKAMERLEYNVTIDCFMNATTQAVCDLIFPLATVAEKEGTVFEEYGVAPLINGFCNPAIEEPGECRSDFEFAYDMGKRLNPDHFNRYNDVTDFINAFRFSNRFDYRELHDQVYLAQESDYYKYETGGLRPDGQPGFATPTGRIELWSNLFNQFGEDPLPYYDDPDFGPINTPEKMEDYPFILTTGARTFSFFHSEHRQIPFLRELNPNPIVEVNPNVAARLGISDGQWCRIWNEYGECVYKAKVTYKVDEKTIHCQHGWWFPEEDGADHGDGCYGTYRSQVNNLLANFHFGKLGFGAPFKCNICNIEPVKESYDSDMEAIWNRFKREDQ
ncbi:MAG: molybdopterin-dependent oxidoreductase, partial [Eggerthellaceae bacterium]|nr:molybdopterin-dependent oxidoreductase [Eggerthellaceae bacterium]